MSEGTSVRFLPDDPQSTTPVALAVFWCEPEHRAVIARWPRLAALLGATWDECRRRTERYCVLVEDNGFRTSSYRGT